MVGRVHLHEHGPDALGADAVEMVADERLVDDDPELTAVAQLGMQGPGPVRVALGDVLQRTVLEEGADRAVHAPGAGPQLPRLRLQAIQLGQHLDGDRHGVLIEFEEGLGIVNQNVGVQDVSLFHVNYPRPRTPPLQT